VTLFEYLFYPALILQKRSSKDENTLDSASEASIALFRSLIARLSGKPPEAEGDFSNMEKLAEEGEEAKKTPEPVKAEPPVRHRRQSYFRVNSRGSLCCRKMGKVGRMRRPITSPSMLCVCKDWRYPAQQDRSP